ncbi:unnamed protein product, partial [Ixodes pacificus]
ETGDAGGVSITGGKSPPLVRVALSFVVGATDSAGCVAATAAAGVATGLVAVAADPGLREDSAVCVLQSLVGGLATAMADTGGPAAVETGVAGGTPVRLAPPLTMSERRLLATDDDGVALSSDGVPWPLASPSCARGKPGRGGNAASSRSNLGASTSS